METSKAGPRTFIVVTSQEDMSNPNIRQLVASHASRYGRQQRSRLATVRAGAILHSFLSWRHGSAPANQQLQKSFPSSRQGQATTSQEDAAAVIERVARNIPASLNTELSLRHCKYISGSGLWSAVLR